MAKSSISMDAVDPKTIKEYSTTGRHLECLRACQQLLQGEPENPLLWKFAGKSLLALGQFKKAQQCLEKAHQLDNKDPEIIKDIGNIFNSLQNDTEAIRLYKAALSIDQNYAPAINNLGLIAKRQGDLIAAEQLVKRACDLDQSFAPYHMNLGGIYTQLGSFAQARASCLKALELKPDNHGALVNLAEIHYKNDELQKAEQMLEESLSIKKTAKAMHLLSLTYSKIGRKEESLDCALSAVKLDERSEDYLINLARTYQLCGQEKKANEAAMMAIEINSCSENNYLATSQILCEQKLYLNARQILEKGKAIIGNCHMIDGELVRVKFLEGLFNDSDDDKT